MIDTKELRRENLVQDAEGNIIIVNTIDSGGINEDWTGPVAMDIQDGLYEIIPGICHEDIDPIPLTPEWMRTCGFVKKDRDEWEGPLIKHDNEIEFFNLKEVSAGLFRLMGSEWPMGKPFTYVHQLQNLYFDLVGEELTIK